ncbi:transposase [Brumimicrobium oceani]|uniref:Transposase n=1 Tax=Brumimicrobium oceani TaxID=2100725 RepID=A0A2U2XE40_9FLAO|nr:transposase [Brumimicrobium oceani]PWH86043.1 transposase [Brumimicrobium oceani]
MKKPKYPNRKSIRLERYDYASQGWYFVTINAVKWKHIFGKITGGKMHPTTLGEIIEEEWLASAEIRKNIKLHSYVVMPNHFHAIVEICYSLNKENVPGEFIAPKHTLSAVMRGFKGAVTRKYKSLELGNEKTVWHGKFNDHIIRNEKSFLYHTNYIKNNVKDWEEKRGGT